jgi:hypothetical protein
MTDEVKMPTRMDAIKGTAKRLLPNHNDLEMLVAAGMSVATFAYSVGVLLVRTLLFVCFPLSLVVLYPVIRANQRRWYQFALDEKKRRAKLIAKLTKQCAKPIDWPHDWAKPTPSADLYRAAQEQEKAERACLSMSERKKR